MIGDSDIVHALEGAVKLRTHLANMAYAADPTDKWLNTRLDAVDTLVAELVGKRQQIEGR